MRPGPSLATKRAAANAATSAHALVNLTRLVGSLDKLDAASTPLFETAEPATSGQAAQRNWENLQYAQLLLQYMRTANEGSSSTISSLDDLEATLQRIARTYEDARSRAPSLSPAQSFLRPAATTAQSREPRANGVEQSMEPLRPAPVIIANAASMPVVVVAKSPSVPDSTVLRQRRANVEHLTEAYLETRRKDDARGAEFGLLPLKVAVPQKGVTDENGARDTLLGGTRPGMGASQLHDELGGQLADMSHRLKLNAIHFANSLEEEKALLDSSTDVLEKNLVDTKSSKKDLSSVSSKGKGTTCLTLGIVILVLIIFVWTYMIIRFT